jgi:diguanylate cyclase (GGDEF)-like protein
MARRAYLDALTGLPNRRAVMRALVREAARARRTGSDLSLLLVDLDDFKLINETQGHAGGDRALRRVGAALRTLSREGESWGRIGGDEFALVLCAGAREADAAVQRVQRGLEAIGVPATAASGILEKNEPLRALYRRVDALLFAAKERRRAARVAT